MRTIIQKVGRGRASVLLLLLGVVLACVLIWLAHRWATAEVVRRASGAGVQVQASDVSIGWDGSARVRNATWSRGPLSATIESIEVEVSLRSLLSTPRVTRIAVFGVEIEHDPSDQASGAGSPSGSPRDLQAIVRSVLARLGGSPPTVDVERLAMTARLGSDRSVRLTLERGAGGIDGDQWRFAAPVSLDAPSFEGIVLPKSADVHTTMKLAEGAWSLGDVRLQFSEPVTARRGGITASVGGVGVTGSGEGLLVDLEVYGASDWVEGPLKIGRVQAGPISALTARDIGSLQRILVVGADMTLRQPAGKETGAVAARNWNERVSKAIDQAFGQADAVLARGVQFGGTTIELADSLVRIPRLDSTFAVRTARMQNTPDGPEAKVVFGWSGGDVEHGVFDVAYAPHKRRVDIGVGDLQLKSLRPLIGREISGVVSRAMFVIEQDRDDDRVLYPVAGQVRVADLRFRSGVVAEQAVEAAPFEIDFALSYAPAGRGEVTTSKGRVRIAEVELDVRPAVFGLAGLPEALPERVELEFALEPSPVQDLLNAIPPAILGPLRGAKLGGTFGLRGRVELPLHAPERMKWDLEPRLENFRIGSLPHDVDVRRLMTTATFTLTDEKLDHQRTVFVGAPRSPTSPLAADASEKWTGAADNPCGSYVYVPLDQISPHLASGVLSTEDRGFLWHDGFNWNALRESLAANIAEGRIVRGGSTITMQLVKNLFLDRSRTISRKLREVFLVWLTESVVDVPKSRLLELYFNVIEYGPRVNGIFHASTYFFGKHPRDLTVGEVAWFITTLTGPKIYHHQFVKRQISENVWDRMRARIDMLYHNDYITELDLVQAKLKRPAFRPTTSSCAPHPAPQPTPSADTEALAAALLNLRRAGFERTELTKRLDDPLWRARALAAPRGARIDWSALPLARDGYGWWRRR